VKGNTGNKIKLGIFVFIGILLFIIGIYSIGQKRQLFNQTFRISGVFKNVNGLQPGNNVRFSGINVGTIEDIEIISDTSVRVDMIIDETTRKFIKKDAVAIIGSDGLMGNKIMIITPGTSQERIIKNNDFIRTTYPINMEDILRQFKTTTENSARITGDLTDIIGNIRSGKGTIGKLFMDTSLAENLDKSIVNIKEGTGGFKQNMDAAKHSIFLRGFLKKRKKEEKKDEKKK
jgi:phospholipid/cholesterol/gamma-HCH transport system substrate-binding protein